eukprot:1952097-Karenia_brevis.AAC.1
MAARELITLSDTPSLHISLIRSEQERRRRRRGEGGGEKREREAASWAEEWLARLVNAVVPVVVVRSGLRPSTSLSSPSSSL